MVVHLLLGFRRLRELDYYRDDPLVLRLMGLRKLPDVSTISRALSQMEQEGVEKVRALFSYCKYLVNSFGYSFRYLSLTGFAAFMKSEILTS